MNIHVMINLPDVREDVYDPHRDAQHTTHNTVSYRIAT